MMARSLLPLFSYFSLKFLILNKSNTSKLGWGCIKLTSFHYLAFLNPQNILIIYIFSNAWPYFALRELIYGKILKHNEESVDKKLILMYSIHRKILFHIIHMVFKRSDAVSLITPKCVINIGHIIQKKIKSMTCRTPFIHKHLTNNCCFS